MPGVIRASDAAARRWFLDGLVAGSARVVAATLSFVATELTPLWEDAKAEGLVVGTVGDWVKATVERLAPGARTSDGERLSVRAEGDPPVYLLYIDLELLRQLERFLETEGAQALAEAQVLCFDAKLLERLAEIHGQSVSEKWTVERLDAELERLAVVWGGTGITLSAGMAEKFFNREILSGAVHGALHEARIPSRELFPYMMYKASPGARANHAALDGFVWRTGSEIEDLIISPNGWSCRCRPIPISWEEARRLGWRGNYPRGLSKVEQFLAMGGPDRGFPKGLFTQGLPESLAGC